MPIIFRGMSPDVTGAAPLVNQNDANALGVRTVPPAKAADVVTYLENEVPWVNPTDEGDPQGISVAFQSGCNLPPHRRPRGAPWNGTGKIGLLMWRMDTATLTPAQLACVAAPLEGQPQHAVVSPGIAMSVATYRGYISGTVGSWTLAPAPDPACPTTTVVPKEDQPMEASLPLERLTASVAAGAEPTELVDALLVANAGGVTAAALVAGVQVAVQRAEEAGNDDGAEALRAILDRISGYCAPTQRIKLS